MPHPQGTQDEKEHGMQQHGPGPAQPSCHRDAEQQSHDKLVAWHRQDRRVPRHGWPVATVDAEQLAGRVQEAHPQLPAERGVELRESRIGIRRNVPPTHQPQRPAWRKRGQQQRDHPELVYPSLKPMLVAEDQEYENSNA